MAHGRRLSAKQYRVAWELCVHRDGEKCDQCGWVYGNPPTPIQLRHPLPGTVEQVLELNHKDGNPLHNEPSNWNLLCKACNLWAVADGVAQMRVRVRIEDRVAVGEKRDERDSGCGDGSVRQMVSSTRRDRALNSEKGATLEVNAICEPVFRAYVLERVVKEKKSPYDDLIDSGAEVAHCSQDTCKRYLRKMCSTEAHLLVLDVVDGEKWVMLRGK